LTKQALESVSKADNSDLSTEFRLHVFKLNGLLLKDTEVSLDKSKLTRAGSLALSVLAASDQPMTASQLAKEIGQSRQGVGRLVNLLAKKGLLELSDNPYHAKSKLIAVSAEGRKEFEKVRRTHNQLQADHPLPLSNDELKAAISVLNKAINHLSNTDGAY